MLWTILRLTSPWKDPKHCLWTTLLEMSHLGDIWDMKYAQEFLGFLILKSFDWVYSRNFVLIGLNEGMCDYLLSLNTYDYIPIISVCLWFNMKLRKCHYMTISPKYFLITLNYVKSSSLPIDKLHFWLLSPSFSQIYLVFYKKSRGYEENRKVDEVLKLFLIILYLGLYLIMIFFFSVWGFWEPSRSHM